ncbi:signal peptidase I [Flavobacterium alkalisoli]|uniref:Signal peptidase I n=1 Tax=Flavobacterium alkalisoli TaxID=2602769 RepID=A0A5B9FTJ3_9FLAO|nr:signal peptidase I [Flavobacterium alkalisoli]QEE48087.1 signal peptidase I [Flavobacterium alkalisoli]
MTLLQWFIFFLAVQVVHYLGTWKLYQKAGRKSWEAAVPVYNAVVLMKIIRKPVWWTILLFIPVVNLIMFPVVWVLTLKSFGKKSTLDTILGIVTLGLYIYYINYMEDVKYITQEEYDAEKKKESTISSLLFAVVVATIVHTYIMQPFTIPTASLEKTLLIGDFLFVSKFHYGARTPMTAVAAPMVHDTIPVINKKSYSNWPQLPSFRLPGFENPEKNDIVVFNWPTDTVTNFRDTKTAGLRKPIDKKSNYVKRCVGTPGDNLSIVNGDVHINGEKFTLSDRAKLQYNHTIYSKKGVTPQLLISNDVKEFYRTYEIRNLSSQAQIDALRPYITGYDASTEGLITIKTSANGLPYSVIQSYQINAQEVADYQMTANLTLEKAEKLRAVTGIDSVIKFVKKNQGLEMFPHTKPTWTEDNMGPIYVPEAGKTVELNSETLPFYKMIIQEYEGNDLKVTGNEIRINGEVATSYTFKQNYYWMMGDNRHNSLDSRFWGFVPEDHIVGKPVFIWMSLDQNESWKNIGKKVRWDRMFTTVSGNGEPVSYFKYFLILLVGWFGFDYFRKKKKKANS